MLLEAYIDTKDIDELARVKEIRARTIISQCEFQIHKRKNS